MSNLRPKMIKILLMLVVMSMSRVFLRRKRRSRMRRMRRMRIHQEKHFCPRAP
jgi:hypothetical protein